MYNFSYNAIKIIDRPNYIVYNYSNKNNVWLLHILNKI